MYILQADATQVGIGSGPVEAAAWVMLIGGVVLAALWSKKLYA